MPHETQAPIPVGGGFTFRIQFPDAGLYWYHPHIREDYTQELGLYGNILVAPAEPGYWPPADRELVLTVDDLLLEGGRIAPFSRAETSYAAMGRFGNVFLVGGEPVPRLEVGAGEVVRLWLTNTANTRVFNLAVAGAPMKLVGGDSGRVEREELVESVLLAPSELAAERERVEQWLAAEPDKVLALVAQMDDRAAMPADAGPVTHACPMHPEVTSDQPGRCPKCGMKLLAVAPGGQDHAGMDHQAMDHGHMDHGGMDHGAMGHGGAEGIEWEDDTVEVNRLTTTATMHWKFLDRTTGADSPAIDWRFSVGDRVKIRLVNEMDSDHPMHHPSTSTGRAASWSWPATGPPSRTWSGRTPCWSAPARSWTSCSMSPTRGCGWPTATSPSTCTAA